MRLFFALPVVICLSLGARAQSTAKPTPRISGGVMAGQVLTKVPPVYPQPARDARVSGAIMMHAIISKEGFVEQLTVLSGPEMLRDAALDAVKQWTYKPFMLNGVPTDADTTITVNFALGDTGQGVAAGDTQGGAQQAQPALPPLPTGRLRVSSGVIAAQKLSGTMPNFCEIGREQRINGTVVLHVVLDSSGHVSEASAISGPQLLTPSAIDAVKTWVYKPYVLNGNPVEVETVIMMSQGCGG